MGKSVEVQGTEISIMTQDDKDFISLTDMLKAKDGDFFISDWLRNRNTVEFLGIWEQIHNPNFNYGEFAIIRSNAGLNSYKISVKEWTEKTNAIGIFAKAGRYGGTYAYKDIAFEFGMWISPEFKIYLIKEFERLKEKEQDKLGWNAKRELAKVNYRIHTDAIKENLIPKELTSQQTSIIYILVVNIENISSVIYEPSHIWQNNKTLEYSCVFKMPTECMVNIEVKTMRCDPFEKETDLKINNIKDGSILIKKLVNDDIGYEKLLCEHQDAVELKNSTYYSAFNRNIKKIVEKFDGEKNIQCRMINIGFICVHFSTSIEEFYTYMFHKEKGIYKKLQWGNLDALVLFVLDARNDILLQNVYEMGYVATMLRNDTEINRKFMEIMRLDNYVLLGDKVVKSVYDEAQKGAKLYRILKRDGFLNILPYDSTEQGIEDYVNYLKSDSVRYE